MADTELKIEEFFCMPDFRHALVDSGVFPVPGEPVIAFEASETFGCVLPF